MGDSDGAEARRHRWDLGVGYATAAALSVTFVVLAFPLLGGVAHDFDESWLMLDARSMSRGARPFVDFAHHEMPLHLYLLAAVGEWFGSTVADYRLLSLASVAASGFLIFCLVQPAAGVIPAAVAEGVFLFSPLQARALTAVPETPMLVFSLLGALLLFSGRDRWSTWASAAAFVLALTTKPTCLGMALAAALALAWARDWRRLFEFALAGIVLSVVALAWAVYVTDGVFGEILRFQLARLGARNVGMWSVDSGFADIRRMIGAETPWDWAALQFSEFFRARWELLPISLFVASLLAIPIWVLGCARHRPDLGAFAVAWPLSYLAVNFLALDFVSMRYFIPFLGFEAFLLAGWVWLLLRWLPAPAVAAAGVIGCALLATGVRPALARDSDPWYWARLAAIAQQYPSAVSFSPMLFAATGAEPGCGLANPVLTYGGFGEAWLLTERTQPFRFSDERLIRCLRAQPDTVVVVDWAFYFFSRPGSPLRAYLDGEGSAQRVFFSQDAVAQWGRPTLQMSPLR